MTRLSLRSIALTAIGGLLLAFCFLFGHAFPVRESVSRSVIYIGQVLLPAGALNFDQSDHSYRRYSSYDHFSNHDHRGHRGDHGGHGGDRMPDEHPIPMAPGSTPVMV